MSNTNYLTGLVEVSCEAAARAARRMIEEIHDERRSAAKTADNLQVDEIAKARRSWWFRTFRKDWSDREVWEYITDGFDKDDNTVFRRYDRLMAHSFTGNADQLQLCRDVVRAAEVSDTPNLYLSLETTRLIGL